MVVTFTNQSSNAANYIWDFGDPASGSNNTSNQPNPSHTFNLKGNYSVKLQSRSIDGCAKDTIYSSYIKVDGVGINEKELKPKLIIIYPNPTRDAILVTGYEGLLIKEKSLMFAIYNVLSEEVVKGFLTDKEAKIKLSGLPSGLYYLKISGEIQKFVIE